MTVRRPAEPGAIPLVPLVDIAMLVLALLALRAASAETRGIPLALAEPTRVELVATALVVTVGHDGAVGVDCAPLGTRPLAAEVRSRLAQQPVPVILVADAAAPYGAVVRAYDALRQASAGIDSTRISVPTQADIARYADAFGVDPVAAVCGVR
jgi:biopolymer transport protein ExbD